MIYLIKRKNMLEALRDAMAIKMAEDDNVVVFGEDVGYFGGVFRATEGLQEEFGKSRVFDTPISELGIIGVADALKNDSKAAIHYLNREGYKTVMLTGDNIRTARAIGKQVGIQEVVAQVLPEEKSKKVEELQLGAARSPV